MKKHTKGSNRAINTEDEPVVARAQGRVRAGQMGEGE